MRLAVLVAIAACHAPATHEQQRKSSTDYADPKMWICRPDKLDDPCHGDLSTTVFNVDGTRTVEPHASTTDAPVDCFYIYPTVDLNLIPGNHTDFSDLSAIRKTTVAQVARFAEVCNVYAPLYRQATISTFWAAKDEQERFFDVAYSDLAGAFHEYLTHFDRGRPIVIIGHSQGAMMASRLLRDTFDQSDQLRPRLLVAMPIGYLVDVPDGGETGGTFDHLVPCTTPDQLGCVITYRSAAAGHVPKGFRDQLAPGHHALCVSPAASATLGESIFPAHGELGVTTPFGSVKGYYSGTCDSRRGGHDYFEIAEQPQPDDKRPRLVRLTGGVLEVCDLGLHIYDFQFAQGDLIAAIKTKYAAWAAAHPSH